MGKLYADAEVTTEKLESMELAFDTDAKYLFKGRDHQGFIVDEKRTIIAYMSLFSVTDTSYACFLIPSVHMASQGFAAARAIKDLLEAHLRQLNWDIVQTVSKDDRIINRWMKFVGFEKANKVEVPEQEGTYYLWRRVNHGS